MAAASRSDPLRSSTRRLSEGSSESYLGYVQTDALSGSPLKNADASGAVKLSAAGAAPVPAPLAPHNGVSEALPPPPPPPPRLPAPVQAQLPIVKLTFENSTWHSRAVNSPA